MKRLTIFLAALMVCAAPVGAEIKKCVGPDGELKYVNTECPDGYRIEASMPASQTSTGSDDEPYICRFADIIGAGEIDSAISEAQDSLANARAKSDREAERYWSGCLGDLKRRKSALEAPIGDPDNGPVPCSEGEFEHRDGGIYFTSSRRGACRGVQASCTFDVRRSERVLTESGRRVSDRLRRDEYVSVATQEVRTFSYDGKVGKFGSVRIGDVDITGRVTGFSCQVVP